MRSRAEMGLINQWFPLDTLATPERIRMACFDEFTSPFYMTMDSEGVLMPLVHEHLMMPWNDLRKGDCCGLSKAVSVGYYCKSCDFFAHKKCGESSEFIQHPSHPNHTLQLRSSEGCNSCNLCGRTISDLFYRCDLCDFDVDLYCAKYPPPEVIDIPETHHHKLNLHKELIEFNCDAKCGKITGAEFPYVCYECQLPFHVDCVWRPSELKHPSEVNHSYHSLHPLKLLSGQLPDNCDGKCRLCARKIDDRLFYHCSPCNFTLDLRCVLNPPQQSLLNLKAHDHQLTLLPRLLSFTCNACGLNGDRSPYTCVQCDFMIHQDCLDLPRVININQHDHRVSRTSVPGVGNSKGVLLPWFHRKHIMMPWNDMRKGDCCGSLESVTDGFYCKSCDIFIHKKCGESSGIIDHSSHPDHTLELNRYPNKSCNLCGRSKGVNVCYRCDHCYYQLDLYCAKYPPPEFIDIPETHHHKLTLLKERIEFDCDAKCGETGDGFAYKCPECDLFFHVDCVWHPPEVNHPLEVNHSYHPWHPLKLHTGQPPHYSDGTCRLCARNIDDRLFYHCSPCNFTLDLRCVLNPPPQSLLNLKAHDHQLILLPRLRSFTCNACGLSGDRSPYICIQCDFMIHQDCLDLPRLINVNRHDHRVSRTSVLGVVNSVCGVCHQKVDWTCGGFSCQRCSSYVVHSKCATRRDVWNGKELEGVPEEIEDIEPYVVIDDNTIQHFSHKEHYLRLHVNDVLCNDNKRCKACTHPIFLQSFYSCMDCDFLLHQNCAGFPRMKRHVLHNERLTLVTNETKLFQCAPCDRWSNGFRYQHGYKSLDLQCGSISEPFVHPSHPDHPLYHTLLDGRNEICDGCKKSWYYVLSCIEDDCRFVLCFKCLTLPQVVKHRVDDDPLLLCYGEKACGKYWCDICEKETNPETWFYTCKDHQSSMHTMCVLGDSVGIMPKSTIMGWYKYYEVVLNNSISRPVCEMCKSRCIFPTIMKILEASNEYVCSLACVLERG
ncbi:unnamed protein product [Arabidopsis thaliana]|uniref:Cysteine/Histidine-rich C1 domain family protein n=2 Tax=Arabidopsis thaliana TaxID=3702 RepID=A0A5S9XPW1_ARATH|nr:unnamed protein product [Arabidopsis thaliana]VYS61579.1 unnamed protein product [Arabidopsis thaliana]